MISPDVIGERMAGPALRFWSMAETLAREGHDVILAVERPTDLEHESFDVVHFTRPRLAALMRWPDVVAIQGYSLYYFPEIGRTEAPLVVDLYDPFHVESFESWRGETPEHRQLLAFSQVDVVRGQLERGDFFLCATERQRMFWLGHLALLGRLAPAEHDVDPTFRRLIDLAPFGINEEPPRPTAPVLKGRWKEIGPDDRVVLWAGGLYDWLDPLTVIRGFAALEADHQDSHLVFLGLKHPNPAVPRQAMAATAVDLVEHLGARRIHFYEEWVPFRVRGGLLLEADVAVSAHPESLETQLAYRTRLLDHLWAGLPTIASEGDELAESIAAAGAGLLVPPGDAGAMESALRTYLGDEAARETAAKAAGALAPEYAWRSQLRPLIDFCANPDPAERPLSVGSADQRRHLLHLAKRFWSYTRQGEWEMASARLRTRLREQLGGGSRRG